MVEQMQIENQKRLSSLHQQSLRMRVSADDIDWNQKNNPDIYWGAPRTLLPSSYVPCIEKVGEDALRAISHSVGAGICEQFIFLEEKILNQCLKTILSQKKAKRFFPQELIDCLEDFVQEEEVHSEMFWRTLQTQWPEHYPTRNFRIFKKTPLQVKTIDFITHHPFLFVVWLWLAILFEERTMDIYKKYSASNLKLIPVLSEVHELHMRDEVRHFSIDEHLLRYLYDRTAKPVRIANAHFFKLIMRQYLTPIKSSLVGFEEAAKIHPHLIPLRDQHRFELQKLGQSRDFLTSYYSPKVLPKTFRLLNQYSEFKILEEIFLCEQEPLKAGMV